MIFIKYNEHNDNAFSFALDCVLSFESTEENKYTKIELINGRKYILGVDIEEFVAKIFSDENLEKEYAIIEIDSPPQVLTANH